ncbi:ABC transporter substrate-binding protein [Mycetocola zhujimingii]|uniref:ABC transporter substrate-binding protein n=1 Tax=Mycetocola zhujimingii TaxID=2079792 RepID=A0A2U1TCJ0_9MICO|nr:ABC transporter substrate-binding protein [Mycetocola zhujimingii]PWC06608.1 ABC transporter substrate-binding protein [Mycetocola zhujimingii]
MSHRSAPPRSAITVAAASVMIIALSGCSTPAPAGEAANTPGITEDTVTIGTHHPLTGPAAAGYASISAATTAYFEYLNEQGGIHGRTIEYVVKDDGYNPSNTQNVVRELVEEDEVFAVVNGLGTPTHTSVLDYLNQKKVPDLFVASGSTSWNQPEKYPYTFAYNVDYVAEGEALAQYAEDEFPGKSVCVLGQDDDFGTEFTTGLQNVLGADGLASVQTYSVSNQDVVAQISAMKAAGCEINMLATVNGFTALAVGTAAKLGYAPQWFSSSSGGDYPTLVTFLGADLAPKLLQGFVSTNYLPFGQDDEWRALFEEINAEYNDDAPFDGNTVYGMSVGYLFAEALAAAGEDPTRESLIEAISSGDLEGNGVVPLSFGDDSHAAFMGVGITTVDGGVQDFVGSTYVSDGKGKVSKDDVEPVSLSNEGVPED